jgi:ribosomal protein S18 acetylase RimI-like enzyme
MSNAKLKVKIRPMELLDLRAIFNIHQKLEAAEKFITYKQFTVRKTFGMTTEAVTSAKRPDILEVAKLINLGLVAEYEGNVCGFVVGRQTYIAERDIEEGEIAIIGVDPDYQRKGIANQLVNAICDLLSSKDVYSVRIGIDPDDEDLLAFFERMGFTGQRLLYMSKTL